MRPKRERFLMPPMSCFRLNSEPVALAPPPDHAFAALKMFSMMSPEARAEYLQWARDIGKMTTRPLMVSK